MNTQTRAASDPAAGKSRRPDGHRVLEALGEAVYVVDRERRCSYANPAGLRLLGLERPEQLLGQDMHEVLHVRQAVNATEHDSSECPNPGAASRDGDAHQPGGPARRRIQRRVDPRLPAGKRVGRSAASPRAAHRGGRGTL